MSARPRRCTPPLLNSKFICIPRGDVLILRKQPIHTPRAMNSKSLVSIDDISRDEILDLIERARYFEENPNLKVLDGKVVATLFFEPSTRTRLSFETAVNRLGGRVIGFSDASTSSSAKGETLKDTIKMVSNYVDLIVMRHHLEERRALCHRGHRCAGDKRRRRSQPAPLADHARPLLHQQDAGAPQRSHNNHGGRPEVWPHRPQPHNGDEVFQPHFQFRCLRRSSKCPRSIRKFAAQTA